MKKIPKFRWIFVLGLLWSCFRVTAPLVAGNNPAKEPNQSKYTVYVFLAETCPISQHYTLTLKELHNTFTEHGFAFLGVFPNVESTPETIAEFNQKYQLPFFLFPDPKQELTKRLNATVTPEVIIREEKTGTIVYQGRIDDSYFRVGKKRPVAREHDLKNALIQLKNNQPVSKPKTEAVGCYITFLP